MLRPSVAALIVLVLAGCQTVGAPPAPTAQAVLDAPIQTIDRPIVLRYGPYPEQQSKSTIAMEARAGRATERFVAVQMTRRSVEQVGEDLAMSGTSEGYTIVTGPSDAVEDEAVAVRMLFTRWGDIKDANMAYISDGRRTRQDVPDPEDAAAVLDLLMIKLPPSGVRTGDRIFLANGLKVSEDEMISGAATVAGLSRYRGREVVVVDMTLKYAGTDFGIPLTGFTLYDRANFFPIYTSIAGTTRLRGGQIALTYTEEAVGR